MANDQLRLRPEKRNRPSTKLDVDCPDRLLFKIRDLNLSQRLELALRAPAALERVVDRIAHVGSLSHQEIEHAYVEARDDLAALDAERTRRRQCPNCGCANGNGHLMGCPAAA
jgi:hypothetical protein